MSADKEKSAKAESKAAPSKPENTKDVSGLAKEQEASPGPDADDKSKSSDKKTKPKKKKNPKTGNKPNNVRAIRIEMMMSKAELARRANLSVLTVDRVEKGFGCRMDTKRKILKALDLNLADRVRVFGEEE